MRWQGGGDDGKKGLKKWAESRKENMITKKKQKNNLMANQCCRRPLLCIHRNAALAKNIYNVIGGKREYMKLLLLGASGWWQQDGGHLDSSNYVSPW